MRILYTTYIRYNVWESVYIHISRYQYRYNKSAPTAIKYTITVCSLSCIFESSIMTDSPTKEQNSTDGPQSSLLIRNRLHYSPDTSYVTLLVLVVPDVECNVIRSCLEDLSYNIEHAQDSQCPISSVETVDMYLKTHWRKYVVYEDQQQASWQKPPIVQPYVASNISNMYILS